jgi:hypothetical protein
MPYWPPDTPPEVPPQMPQATSPGPAPVPYGGPGFALAPDTGAAMPDVTSGVAAGAGVLIGVTGANHVTSSPLAAPNVNPYEAGAPDPVYVGGDADAGGRDIVAGTVAGAVAAAEARFGELRGDTYGQGSQIGDSLTFPPSPLDPGAGLGLTDPAGHYYDPPRTYGDEP